MRVPRSLLVSLIVSIITIVPLGSALAQASAHFRLPADAAWVDSGFALTAGQPVTIDAQGMAVTARINLWGTVSLSGPDGQSAICPNFDGAPACAMENAPFGALVGKIGENGTPFLIGSHTSFTPEASGKLYLAVNDYLVYYSDNYGNYTVFPGN